MIPTVAASKSFKLDKISSGYTGYYANLTVCFTACD